MQESRTTSVRTPKFYDLCARLKRMSIEHPNTLIVAETHFITSHGGMLTFHMCRAPALLDYSQIAREFILNVEVESVRDGILLGLYQSDDLSTLEEWSENAIEVVECACKIHDLHLAKQLRELNRLH